MQMVTDGGLRFFSENGIIHYFGTNFLKGYPRYASDPMIPIINRFDFTLDVNKNIINAKFIFPGKQYKSSTDGIIEFKVDLEQEELLFMQVDEFQGNRSFEKLELSENEILELSKRIHKKFLDHIEGIGDDFTNG